jgi:hypothetical protein
MSTISVGEGEGSAIQEDGQPNQNLHSEKHRDWQSAGSGRAETQAGKGRACDMEGGIRWKQTVQYLRTAENTC